MLSLKALIILFAFYSSGCVFLQTTLEPSTSWRVDSAKMVSILQGPTTDAETIFRVVHPLALNWQFKIVDKATKAPMPYVLVTHRRPFSEFAVSHLSVTQLNPQKEYELIASTSGVSYEWEDRRSFKTLSPPLKNLRVLLAGCLFDAYNEIGNQLWPKAFALKPDLTILTGDNAYVDTYPGALLGKYGLAKPEHIWNRHVDHAMRLAIYRQKYLTPTITVWDDHDYGANDGDHTYKFKSQSLETYQIFFPPSKNSLKNTNAYTYDLGPLRFIMLDGRTHRGQPIAGIPSHYGQRQQQWLAQQLMPSHITQLSVIVSGSQFFGGFQKHFESFERDFPQNFADFLKNLSSTTTPLLFISGDRHNLETMRVTNSPLNFNTEEWTVSGLQAPVFSGTLNSYTNPWRLNGFDGKQNFAIVDFNLSKPWVHYQMQAFSTHGKEFEQNGVLSHSSMSTTD